MTTPPTPAPMALYLTFADTTDALAAEACFHTRALPGRLIPTPKRITADCGLAWLASPDDRDPLLAALNDAQVRYDACVISPALRRSPSDSGDARDLP